LLARLISDARLTRRFNDTVRQDFGAAIALPIRCTWIVTAFLEQAKLANAEPGNDRKL
jgi:hypothetical protein